MSIAGQACRIHAGEHLVVKNKERIVPTEVKAEAVYEFATKAGEVYDLSR
jgi:hypothetical protein